MYFKEEIKESIMDITDFNKELGKKIAIAQRFEIRGDIQAAIQEWIDISEMALNFSKSPKINASFKNMIINRTKGIFAHIKELKENQIKEESYIKDFETPKEVTEKEKSPHMSQNDKISSQEEDIEMTTTINSTSDTELDINEESDLKNLPEGFKEIKTSKDFKIITPHDKDYIKKQRAKVEENERIMSKKKEISDGEAQKTDKIDIEKPTIGENLICFACGSPNDVNDKICKNCGTNLN